MVEHDLAKVDTRVRFSSLAPSSNMSNTFVYCFFCFAFFTEEIRNNCKNIQFKYCFIDLGLRNARLNFKEQKEKQERKSLENINDSFKKIIIVKDDIMKTRKDKGIITISLKNFLLDEDALNY